MANTIKNQLGKAALYSAATGLIIGLAVSWLNPGSQPWKAFLVSFFLTGGLAFLLASLCHWLEINRSAKLATAISFGLRLLIGIILFITLPIYGYDEAPPNNGYLYLDAYERDADAWELAVSGQSLASAFQNEFYTDQYGGLLSLSAGAYRLLSPDSHRPLLILILTSFFSAFGLPFFWKGIRDRWGERTANASAWIYAFYPESIILGASQMREPILIGLSSVALWGVLEWKRSRKHSMIALVLSALLMAFISIKATAAILLCIAVWFWLENLLPNTDKKWRLVSYALVGFVVIAGVILSWGWLVDSSKWDLYLMEGSSGRIQWEVELIGERFRAPFIIGYGLAQPVLPAAIIYPGLPITRAIAVFRSLGWYLLAPVLISGFILVWKNLRKENRNILLFFFAIALIWTIISSARAGGDQWDNPRYRSIFLVWMVFLGGWSFAETLNRRSPWLWRLLFLEVVYIGFFIQWYLSRYYGLFKRMNFWPMVSLLGGIGALTIFGGLLIDLIYNRYRQNKSG